MMDIVGVNDGDWGVKLDEWQAKVEGEGTSIQGKGVQSELGAHSKLGG